MSVFHKLNYKLKIKKNEYFTNYTKSDEFFKFN